MWCSRSQARPPEKAPPISKEASLWLFGLPGSWATKLDDPRVGNLLSEANAILFVIAWGSPQAQQLFSSISGAWSFCENRPKALIFTQSECGLTEESELWKRPESWWKSHPWSLAHAETIQRFGAAVWPVSAYGYHSDSGYPAVILGKYGQLRPHEIRPRNVSEPFEWLMNQMPTWPMPTFRSSGEMP